MIVLNTVFLLSRPLGAIINRLLGIKFYSLDLFESGEKRANFVLCGAGGEVVMLNLKEKSNPPSNSLPTPHLAFKLAPI